MADGVAITGKLVYEKKFVTTDVLNFPHRHTCNECGKFSKQVLSKGYSNLVSHIKGCSPEYERDIRDILTREAGGGGTLTKLYFFYHLVVKIISSPPSDTEIGALLNHMIRRAVRVQAHGLHPCHFVCAGAPLLTGRKRAHPRSLFNDSSPSGSVAFVPRKPSSMVG